MDVNSLFARAEQAFLGGRLAEARRDLTQVLRLAGDHPAVLHLAALVEKKSGDIAAARGLFARAVALAPGDAQLLGNHANLLSEHGDPEQALAAYGRALAAHPGHKDARYNRALLLQRLGRPEEALADLDAIRSQGPADAKIHSARGSVLKDLGRSDEAVDAYDTALRADPGRLTALHGRARLAMERGEAEASAFYARALELKPGDPDLILGFAEALEAQGEELSLKVLGDAVAARPDWVVGHETLARMRSEAGDAERFADHYHASLEARPGDRALHYSHWQSLARGELYGEALAALHAARTSIEDAPEMRLMEAIFTSESGDPEKALALLDRLPELAADPGTLFARGRIALRAGKADEAAGLFEHVTEGDPASVNGWAHLDLAWRLTGDRRHEWLTLQPGLFGTGDIGLSAAELDETAALLRTLHKTRAHPIGQSLRGGTQTRGRLFWRQEPAIARLHEAIFSAVRAHVDALPPRDERHPLLRYRDCEFGIEGSWSVRLTGQGFHVNHIHPEGVLSSACYIALPPSLGGDAGKDGWLELGRPPAQLPLGLEPIAQIEPKPGRLALFPSYLFHGTRPFAEGERLTVAFDVAVRG